MEVRTVLPTFLSKVRACTVGSATGLAPPRGVHRSGTVPDSHRLRDHAALTDVGVECSTTTSPRPTAPDGQISAGEVAVPTMAASPSSRHHTSAGGGHRTMVESRWVRRIGPGLAALGAVAAIATTTLGAPDRIWDPPPCPADATRTQARPGTWWRLDPLLAGGRLSGQRLAVGGPGTANPRRLDLTAESFAAGPFDGRVLVGSDDGRRSTLSLVDPARGCAQALATMGTAVIRRATLTPDRQAVIEFRVDRRTRADLGVFRRPVRRRRSGDATSRIRCRRTPGSVPPGPPNSTGTSAGGASPSSRAGRSRVGPGSSTLPVGRST